MRNIDIIKGVQFVGDDLISRAADCSPYPKRSIKGYIAAAACLLLVIAVIPVVIVKLNNGGLFSSPVERLDADEYGRTFYNMTMSNWPNTEDVEAGDGKILLSPVLEEMLALPHSANDRFAVTIWNIGSGSHDYKTIYDRFTVKYDENDIAKNDPSEFSTVYVTEEQLRSMEPLPDMCLCVAPIKRFGGSVFLDEEKIKDERFSKFYGEIRLKFNEDDAMETLGLNKDETSSQDPAVLAELERYYREFAADYGIDPDKIFAGGVTRTFYVVSSNLVSNDPNFEPTGIPHTNIALYGEFETAVIEKMLGDERVDFILKTTYGGYIYEERGLWAHPTIVSNEQVSAIPAGTTYGDIVKKLGHTAQYGYNSLHVYLADPGGAAVTSEYGIIILDFDDPNEPCPCSGDELLSKAAHLEKDLEHPSYESRYLVNAVVLKNNLVLISYKNGLRPVRLNLDNASADNIIGLDPRDGDHVEDVIWVEQRPASKDEVFRSGARLSIAVPYSYDFLEDNFDCVFPLEYDCNGVVIFP